MIISFHQIIQHIPPFLYEFDQRPGGFGVIRVLFDMLHHEYNFLAHRSTLNTCTTVIKQVQLILFDSLSDPKLENFPWSGIFQGEDSFDHFVSIS